MLTELLCRLVPPVAAPLSTVYDGRSKVAATLGDDFLPSLRGKVVLDYGCGSGAECVDMAGFAARVIGYDTNRELIANTAQSNVLPNCTFTADPPEEAADVVVCLDCFEHFANPEAELHRMYRLLRPEGCVYLSSGWLWKHPNGSHLVELPPWSHLVLPEHVVVEWRQRMRPDGARSYEAMGLNRMTVTRLEDVLRQSDFVVESLTLTPIRAFRHLHCRLTREYTTSVVRAVLKKQL